MTTSTTTDAPTNHDALKAWVDEIAALTKPDAVYWCDGSEAENEQMMASLIAGGTFTKLDKKPDSYWCASDPSDVARVEDRTFICSVDPEDAGPTNHWMAPDAMKATLTPLFDGAMRGRTMYVIPFVMGRLNAEKPVLGVEITDSPYVVVSMRIMTRMGQDVLDAMGTDAPFVKCLHSVGAPLADHEQDVPWPCNDTKYLSLIHI